MTLQWIDLTCPVCGFRHSPKKFTRAVTTPIDYPAQIVTGGGRGSGFHTVRYIPWLEVSTLRQDPVTWRGINCEYVRLAFAYDKFHETLGFLSPQIRQLIDSLNEEVFRLRQENHDLREARDRSILTHQRGDRLGEFSRLLEEISGRDTQERHSALDLFK